MRIVKTFVFKYILEILNNVLKGTSFSFLPLNAEINENINKDFNEELLERTMNVIFINSSLNIILKSFDESNKNLVEKVCKYNSQTESKDTLKLKNNGFLLVI